MNPSIEIPAGHLKAVLAGFGKIISPKTTLPVLQHIRVVQDQSGLKFQATDLENFATCLLAPTKTDFNPFLVPYEPLSRILKKSSSNDRVIFIPESSTRITLRCLVGQSSIDQSIETLPFEEFPPFPQISSSGVLLPPEFKTFFKEALECASTNETRLILNGVCIDVRKPENHYLVGTDGRHLYAANSLCIPLAKEVIIPTRKFITWPGFMQDGDWSLAVEPGKEPEKGVEDPGWLQLQSQRWTFITRQIAGNYPLWSQVVPDTKREQTNVNLSPEAAAFLLDVIPRLPGNDMVEKSLWLEVRERNFRVHACAQGSESWTEVPVSGASVQGPPVMVVLNRSYLLKALRFGFTQIGIQDSLSPVLLQSNGRTFLIMPVRLETTPPSSKVPFSTDPQPEAAPDTNPSVPEQEPATEPEPVNRIMPESNTMTAPERGDIKVVPPQENKPALKSLIDHIDQIKTTLKTVVVDLNETVVLLKAAEKEKRATEKEVEQVRSRLRSLQEVSL